MTGDTGKTRQPQALGSGWWLARSRRKEGRNEGRKGEGKEGREKGREGRVGEEREGKGKVRKGKAMGGKRW